VFLKSHTDVNLDFAAVRTAMLLHPPRWLDGLLDAAEEDGERLLVQVGLSVGGHELGRRAWLEAGTPIATDRVVSLPLRMRVEDHERLFPTLEGSLDAAWLGPGCTHLALAMQYEPPLGVVGKVVDRALLHRVAEVVAQRFLENAARHLASL
jgi:hypothetical protein